MHGRVIVNAETIARDIIRIHRRFTLAMLRQVSYNGWANAKNDNARAPRTLSFEMDRWARQHRVRRMGARVVHMRRQ
jgi:hypothetical protein